VKAVDQRSDGAVYICKRRRASNRMLAGIGSVLPCQDSARASGGFEDCGVEIIIVIESDILSPSLPG